MIQHTTDSCPVDPDTMVRVDLGDGAPFMDRAGDLSWGPGAGPEGEGRIVQYETVWPLTRSTDKASARRFGAIRARSTSTRCAQHWPTC